MILNFYCNDLLNLLKLSLDLSLPIATAPFILAVFGFRGTSRTALIGIFTGILSILAWNKWIEPTTGINGSFICMLANGLAMMAAHYLLKQPEDVGWVGPGRDDAFKQMQQVHARRKNLRQESIKNGLIDIKSTLAKLEPSNTNLRCVGIYLIISNLLTYFIASITDHSCWLIAQMLVAICFLGYSTFVSNQLKPISGWIVGLLWVIGVCFCFPINMLWHWCHGTTLLLTLALSLTHLVVTLLVLPLYLSVTLLIFTLLIAIYFSPIYVTKPLILVLSPSDVAWLLFLFLWLGLFIFGIFIYFKSKISTCFEQVGYLRYREKIRASQQLKGALYDATAIPFTGLSLSRGYGSILGKVVGKVERSISFLDSDIPLYKQDLNSIFNKLYDWIAYFHKKEKAKEQALLQPTKISLDKLILKVEFALSQEVTNPPRLFIKKVSGLTGEPSPYIICDINQVVYFLVQAILSVSGTLDGSTVPIVSIQFHKTSLQFKQADPIKDGYPSFMVFEAIGVVISNAAISCDSFVKVKYLYDDRIESVDTEVDEVIIPSIDIQKDTIASMVRAHYGYFEYPTDANEKTMLLVLPIDLTEVRDKMMVDLPLDCLTSEVPVTPKDYADSMVVLMEFHDYVCKSSHPLDPIDVSTISGLLLLLRQHFGFKRHASGQLFYVRAVGIASLVVEWVFHSPKVVYASLLYELVRHTCLPLSYIKRHYNLGVYAFVLNVVAIDKREALNHPSLLYVQNRLKEAIKKDHIQLSVLFIKLAERLYDLRHAEGYTILEEIKYIANETLTIDVELARQYLGAKIAGTLASAASKAFKIYHRKKYNRIRN